VATPATAYKDPKRKPNADTREDAIKANGKTIAKVAKTILVTSSVIAEFNRFRDFAKERKPNLKPKKEKPPSIAINIGAKKIPIILSRLTSRLVPGAAITASGLAPMNRDKAVYRLRKIWSHRHPAPGDL
jgi:hypothetical protein